MTSHMHFELFMKHLRAGAHALGRKPSGPEALRTEAPADVGTLRLSHIEAAIKEARADRPRE